MLRLLTAFVLCAGVLAMATIPTVTAEEKEVKKEEGKSQKLVGTITCAKCDLKVEGQTKCHTVIKVGEKVYWFDEKSSKANHGKICTEPKEGTVEGVVSKDGDKMIVTASKVSFK